MNKELKEDDKAIKVTMPLLTEKEGIFGYDVEIRKILDIIEGEKK